MPLSEPAERSLLHERTIDLKGYTRADGQFDLEATLTDSKQIPHYIGTERGTVEPGVPIHLIHVRMTVDDQAVITAFEVDMASAPYSYCSGAEPNYQALVGLKLDSGLQKAVAARLGNTGSCWHVRQLFTQLATVTMQTMYTRQKKRNDALPRDQRPPPAMLDTCYGWKSDQPHVQEDHPEYYRKSSI